MAATPGAPARDALVSGENASAGWQSCAASPATTQVSVNE